MAEPTLFRHVSLVNLLPSPLEAHEGRHCCVYALIHHATGRVYIGSTLNVRKRWGNHRSALSRGVHHNRYLQAAWNKYGGASFEWRIIESPCRRDLLAREAFWVRTMLSSHRERGFNVAVDVQRNSGWRHTDESRAKMSQTRTGRPAHPASAAAMLAANRGNTRGLGHSFRGRLTEAQAREVIELAAGGVRSKAIAARFGILRQQVDRIRRGDRWVNLSVPAELSTAAKARQYARGSGQPTAKLRESQVATIKRRLAAGEHYKAIASDFSVSPGVVQHIKHGRQWKHVTPEIHPLPQQSP